MTDSDEPKRPCDDCDPETTLGRLNIIKEGWANFIFPTKEAEKIAEERSEICADCPSAEQSYVFRAINNVALSVFLLAEKAKPKAERKRTLDSLEIVLGLKCAECGCPIPQLTRSPAKACPLNKWNQKPD